MFTSFTNFLELQQKNGLQFSDSYKTDMACRRFIESIYEVLKARHVEKMKQSNFISIQTDSSTDTGQCDNEAIYVRFLKEGSPVTSYLTIQELEDGTGVGHLNTTDAAIKAAGFPGWKEKTVGLGTDGASVMVGEEMGVAGLLHRDSMAH